MTFYPLEKLPLPEGFRRCYTLEGVRLMLVQDQGQSFLFENRCPHMDWSLEYGEIDDGHIICPKHRIRFCLATGEGVTPAPIPPLRQFLLRQSDGFVGIDLDSLRTPLDH